MMESTTTGRSDIVIALRNFSYLWLILSVVSLMSVWLISNAEFEAIRRIYTLVHAIIWALYLSLPKLERRLGSTYLPVALGLAVLGLFMVQIVSILSGFSMENAKPLTGIFNVITFMSICTVITLIVGWKYHLRQVIIVSLVYSVFIAASITCSVTNRPEHFVATVIVISLFISTSLGVVGYFVWRLSQAEQSQRQQLAVANGQLRRQAIQREELTISRERNRLARELRPSQPPAKQVENCLIWKTFPTNSIW